MHDKKETWLPIDGCNNNYSVSDLGRVRSEPRTIINNGVEQHLKGKILKTPISKSHGYPVVNIKRNDKQAPVLVHRLVAETFLGSCPEGMECAHDNGNRKDPSVGNLIWKTRAGNMEDKIRHETTSRGSAHPLAKLTEESVRSILSDDRKQAIIAEEYGVDQSLISKLKNGKIWPHITGSTDQSK